MGWLAGNKRGRGVRVLGICGPPAPGVPDRYCGLDSLRADCVATRSCVARGLYVCIPLEYIKSVLCTHYWMYGYEIDVEHYWYVLFTIIYDSEDTEPKIQPKRSIV